MYIKYKKPNPTPILKAILTEYVKYGYLQSNFLTELLDGKVGKKYLVRKQKEMRERFGLLHLPTEQDMRRVHHDFYIHALTPRGEEFAKELGINPHIVASIVRREPSELRGEYELKDVETRNFWHAMGIINTLASIEIGARQLGIKFIPEGEIRERYRKTNGKEIEFAIPFDTMHNGERVTGKRKRDYLFGLTYENGLSSFFLGENERDNPIDNPDLSRDGSSWLGKDIAYRDIINKKTYKEYLGVPNLKLLVTTKNETKSHHQMEESEKRGEFSNFLFKNIPDQKYDVKSPKPFPEILTEKWLRAGYEPVPLYKPPQ